MPPNINGNDSNAGGPGGSTPPRTHSPSLVRGVSTLGRKFSRKFEKFGDSEAARKLRMASPSRKYQFNQTGNGLLPPASSSSNSNNNLENNKKSSGEKVVSRVDSFRNFFMATASSATLKTPRAVKRRSRNTEKNRSISQIKLAQHADAATQSAESTSSAAASAHSGIYIFLLILCAPYTPKSFLILFIKSIYSDLFKMTQII